MSIRRAGRENPAGGLGEEAVHGGEGLRADMVLDAFRVDAGGAGRNAEGFEERHHFFVPSFRAGGQRVAGSGEKDGTVGTRADETLALQALDGADDCDMGDAEGFGDIRGAGLAVFSDEVRNGLDIILGAFLRMGAAGVALDRGRVARRGRGFPTGGGFGFGRHGTKFPIAQNATIDKPRLHEVTMSQVCSKCYILE